MNYECNRLKRDVTPLKISFSCKGSLPLNGNTYPEASLKRSSNPTVNINLFVETTL